MHYPASKHYRWQTETESGVPLRTEWFEECTHLLLLEQWGYFLYICRRAKIFGLTCKAEVTLSSLVLSKKMACSIGFKSGLTWPDKSKTCWPFSNLWPFLLLPLFPVVHCIGWKYSSGFVTATMIQAHLPPASSDVLVVLCGPPPMIQYACLPNLEKLGYKTENIFAY